MIAKRRPGNNTMYRSHQSEVHCGTSSTEKNDNDNDNDNDIDRNDNDNDGTDRNDRNDRNDNDNSRPNTRTGKEHDLQ
jgi:hypothetical protein